MVFRGKAFLKKKWKNKRGKDSSLYKLNPSLNHRSIGEVDYVLISRVKILGADVPFHLRKKLLVDETIIFASDRFGFASIEHELEIIDKHINDEEALRRIGYEIGDIKLKPITRKHFGDIIENI